MGRPLRIIYVAGPGDVLGTYQYWKQGRDDPRQVSMTYSGQFFDVCQELGAQALVLASSRQPGRLRDGQFTILHRPIPFEDGPGPLHHVGQWWTALRLAASAVWFRADAAVILNEYVYWFPLALLLLFRVKVIPSLHCALWPKSRPPTGLARIIWKVDAWLFRRFAFAILSASRDIEQQVMEATGGRHRPVVEFLPTYRRDAFASGEPSGQRRPFRVLFVGRIERSKGVFDLLAIARRFVSTGRGEVEFDICGDGSHLAELKRQAEEAGLASRFRCHGYCSKPTMREMFARSHVVIVPTTSEFIEGFNQVVAEGVLNGRPVITSSVCPALDYVRGAVVEVPPDAVTAYGDAILRLCDDEEFYRACCRSCTAAQPQFYDESRSFAAALRKVLGWLRGGQPVLVQEAPKY